MRAIVMICSAIALTLTAASPVLAQQKTVKACQEEWRANRAANQAKGITERAYVDQCRSGGSAAAPATTSRPSTATAPPATSAPPSAAPSTRPPTTGATAPPGANEFTSEAQAKAHCPSDTVVWANLRSHIYHFQGSRNFGKTKSGAFMCQKDANSAGMRAAKNEKQPG